MTQPRIVAALLLVLGLLVVAVAGHLPLEVLLAPCVFGANALYPKFKQALLNKEHDLDSDSIKVYLVDGADYTYNAAHDEITDVPSGARVATSSALGSPTITNGTFDTADFTWSAVTGDQSEDIISWNDTPTTPTADPLIAFYDTGITGMPVTPNGGDINVTVNASGWFSL